MIKILAISFTVFLFAIFIAGCVRIIFSFRKSHDSRDGFRLLLLLVFTAPFVIYFLISLLDFRFGHKRNFFYLLPIYFFIIFYALEGIIRDKRLFNWVSSAIVGILLVSGIASIYIFEKEPYAEREKIKCTGAHPDSGNITISSKYSPWLFSYYTKKYGVEGKVHLDYDGKKD